MAFVPNSPAVKRQKTTNGYNSSNPATAYNSEGDDGDELFAGYIPDTPAKQWETQPTQIINQQSPPFVHSHHFQSSNPFAPSSSQATAIQVPASSPLQSQSPRPPMHAQRPTQTVYPGPQRPKQGQPQLFPINRPPKMGNFPLSIAPAGTTFRPPQVRKPTVINLDDDEGPKFQGGSSDSDIDEKANIQPTFFKTQNSSSSFPQANFFINGNLGPQYGYQTPYNGNMSTSMGGVRNPSAQRKPERPRPVVAPVSGPAMVSSLDPRLRDSIARLQKVYPSISPINARNALLIANGSLEVAVENLGRHMGSKPVAKAPDIVISDDEVELVQAPIEPQMKRGINTPMASIKDRYSSTQNAQFQPRQYQFQQQPRPSASATPFPAKPKRKLVQGRRNLSSSAQPSPLKPVSSPPISIHDYDTDDDSGVEEEPVHDSALEAELLKYLNNCKLEELIELTNTTKVNGEFMLAARPFKNLDAARMVTNSAPLKGGKKSTRAPIGEKIVDIAEQMFEGYHAIDSLVSNCEQIGKPLSEEMATWGFDVFGAAKGGELEMTSFEDDSESQRDSGIGSPSSGAVSVNGDAGDDDIKSSAPKRKRSTINYLKKPAMMADDCVLKDYQLVGLNWLALMYRHKLSGILADEMGLGKTCQVIALLSHLVETGHPGPHLVICPGSTLENWLREVPKFSPKLVCEPYYGAQKDRQEMADSILERRGEINVIITTYDLAAKPLDNKFMRRLKPDVAVYDEGHYLKNVNSQRYESLVKIPSNFRLLLTGTPLQNNLQELAALLAFILPGVFREKSEQLSYIFKAKASTRDADHAALLSAQRIVRARSMLTPFVLRRKKTQVLKHLPAKTCRVEYCEMLPAQQAIYDGHIEQARERARVRVEGGKVPKSDENNPLMQLRKASIHPLLFRRHFTDAKVEKMADILRKKVPSEFDPAQKREHLINEMKGGSDFFLHAWCCDFPCIKSFDIPNLAWLDSGKVAALVKLVKQYKENGDRVLIFSQFSLVLDILQSVLNTSLIAFTRIDGSTKIEERQTLIDIYRDDPSITAFLLTTKAGGTGINLMYANKVIIFDGSFNPQDDRQAENRAHRVGQTREVEVVRLVTRNTIEEAIFALGISKLVLDGRVAGDDEAGSEESGEKAVSKMLLDGTIGSNSKVEPDAEDKDKVKESEAKPSGRKKSTILDLVTKRSKPEVDEDGEEILV